MQKTNFKQCYAIITTAVIVIMFLFAASVSQLMGATSELATNIT